VWIEVADKVRREYGFGGGAQPAKFLQVGVAGVVQFGGEMVGQWWMVFGWIAELRGVFGLCVELKEFAFDYNADFRSFLIFLLILVIILKNCKVHHFVVVVLQCSWGIDKRRQV
jgi:hypothetical protein